jgi:predicted nucleic acid-binding protein
LVLDCSATLAWVYADELTGAMDRVFDEVARSGADVPTLWRLEVANALTMGMRRGRIDRAYRDAVLADLARLDIKADPDTHRHAWGRTRDLADRFRLTLYDAAYLELAQRRGLRLATLDQALARAAGELGITLFA